MESGGRALLGAVAALLAIPVIIVAAIAGGGAGGNAVTTCAGVSVAAVGVGQRLPSGATVTSEMADNARIIARVGQELDVGEDGIVIAFAAALVESGMRNLDYGDRDSLGLFQQRPSQGWGTPEQILDPEYASRKFYEALLAIDGWEELDPGDAAQRVQRSAYPDRYGERMADAGAIAAEVLDVGSLDVCIDGPGQLPELGDLVEVSAPAGGTITVGSAIAEPLRQLLAAAEDDGVILGGSGYRSHESQIELRRQHCGSTQYDIYERPANECSPPTARPGSSLHEVGLAVDFTCGEIGGTVSRGDRCDTWLTANADDFGLFNLPSEAWHYSTTGA